VLDDSQEHWWKVKDEQGWVTAVLKLFCFFMSHISQPATEST
jgi:hypothetical protein